MFRRCRSSERGHRVVQTMLGQADHVHIPFNNQNTAFTTQTSSRLPKAVELTPLGEQRGFGGIQVLLFAFANNPTTKADQLAAAIADGEHDALAKAVIATAVLRFDH